MSVLRVHANIDTTDCPPGQAKVVSIPNPSAAILVKILEEMNRSDLAGKVGQIYDYDEAVQTATEIKEILDQYYESN